jgi:GNAT superfamily N-acetyltransferase
VGPAEREALRAILEQSFPPEEREDFDHMMAAIERGDAWLYVAYSGEQVVGLAEGLPLQGVDVHLLGYLAVAPDWRNRRVGASILAALARQVRQWPGVGGLVLEVMSDDDAAATAEERALRVRRIGFYKRNGLTRLERVPALRVPAMEGEGTLEIKLMWLPLRTESELPEGERLRRVVTRLLRDGYSLPEDHPLLREALAKLSRRAQDGCQASLGGQG